jgi:hypothetical protein
MACCSKVKGTICGYFKRKDIAGGEGCIKALRPLPPRKSGEPLCSSPAKNDNAALTTVDVDAFCGLRSHG